MFEEYIPLIENSFFEIFKNKNSEYSKLNEAVLYSLSAGGKRIRPCLLLEFTKLSGEDPRKALNFACALEMIHTYSLIHDDLPCMDNDDFRRGKPSCHKAFDEATALLAGDALLTEAFNTALATENVDSKRIVEAARVLAECSGINGMIGGQVIDLKYEDSTPPLNSVLDMYRLKTSKLLVAAAKIGCIIGGADKTKINNAAQFAEKIGLAFQIMDDILDITSTSDVLGKPVGSDEQANKSTYVSLVGLENAKHDVEILTNEAITLLDCFGSSAEELKKFALMLCKREK